MTVTEDTREWRNLTADSLLGGLVLDGDTELLEIGEFTQLDSFILRDKRMTRDTGYAAFSSEVRGRPRRHFAYVLVTGDIHEILITDATVYKLSADNVWEYVSDGTDTTLSGNEALGQTVLSVTSEVGFGDGDFIGIMLDTGAMHMTTINGAPAAGIITITDALPSVAASGNAVVRATTLTGVPNRHVIAVSIPWNKWIAFTNGINNVKRYDPTTGTVEDIPGLPTNTVCQTLALYDNSLLLGNTTENGVRYPYRFRYCAKGDGTEWTLLEAGYVDILDSSHDIIQMLGLGPYLILYRDKSIARVNISSSGNKRFDTNTTVNGVGVFTNLAAIDLIDKHIVWANTNFFWYKGGFSVEEIGNPVKDYVFGPAGTLRDVTLSRAEVFSVLLPQNNEVLYIHKVNENSADPNVVLRYHLDYNKWSTRTFADTFSGWGEHILADSVSWDELGVTWEELVSSWAGFDALGEEYVNVLCAASPNQSMLYDRANPTDNGEVITGIAETKDFAHPTYIMRHDFLEIGVKNGSVVVEISLDKGVTWSALGTAIGDANGQRSRLFKQVSSRTIRYRFTTTDLCTIVYLNMRYKFEFEW